MNFTIFSGYVLFFSILRIHFSFLSNAPHIIKLKFYEIKNTVRVPSRMKITKNPAFLHYFSKFMGILILFWNICGRMSLGGHTKKVPLLHFFARTFTKFTVHVSLQPLALIGYFTPRFKANTYRFLWWKFGFNRLCSFEKTVVWTWKRRGGGAGGCGAGRCGAW